MNEKDILKISESLKAALTNVIEETDVGNTIGMYDTGHEDFNAEVIATDAAEFVLKGLIGALCYNVVEGYRGNGQKMLNNALDQVDQAANADAQFSTEQTQDRLNQRIQWAARMDVQQTYRAALQDFVKGLYVAITGEAYQAKVARSIKPGEGSAEQNVASRLLEARRSNAS